MQPNEYLVAAADLWIAENRQRQLLEVSELKESLEQLGQLQNIVITNEAGPEGQPYKVLAGARRTTAAKELGWLMIRAVFLQDLDAESQEIIELHENIKRSNLTWQEEAVAIARFFKMRSRQPGGTNMSAIAEELNLPPVHVSRCLSVIPYLISNSPNFNEKIARAETLRAASDVVERRRKMAEVQATSNLVASVPMGQPAPTINTAETTTSSTEAATPAPSVAPIVQGDALIFLSTYSGPRFDFIHADWPYGIGFEGAKTARVEGSHQNTYDDSPEVFMQLMDAFCEHYERVAAPQCHMLFWFDMRWLDYIKRNIHERTDFVLVDENPLIWGRSDNSGILSDYQRRFRHIYEIALVFSRGDRKMRATVSDCIWAPSLRQAREHRSEKPEPMLRQVLPAFIDSETSVLDFTCGSGTSLIVADELGASRVYGIELDAKVAAAAAARFASVQALRKTAELIK